MVSVAAEDLWVASNLIAMIGDFRVSGCRHDYPPRTVR